MLAHLPFVKAKAIPLQASKGPEAPRFQDNRHMKVVRLSALRTGRLYFPGNIPGSHFCQRLSRPQGHSAARRIMSMKNSIGDRTRDLPTCSAVPQPTAPPRAPHLPFVTILIVLIIFTVGIYIV